MALGDDVAYLLKHAIPDALEPILRQAVGGRLPRTDEGGRFRIAYTGAFSSRVASDLLAFARNQHLDGALVIVDDDVLRTIYTKEGRVVGADSNVLFERLGRTLLREALIDEATANELIAREETSGVGAATCAVAPELAKFGLERRVWDIVANLFLIHHGHFVIVEGVPNLGDVELVDLAPMDLALEGLRRYDTWRNGAAGVPIPQRRAPQTRPPEAPSKRPANAKPSKPSAVDQFMAQLRDEMK